ncbi:MAG: hypothetical protein WBD55_13535, partial [Dehalococcoidia bacterium]
MTGTQAAQAIATKRTRRTDIERFALLYEVAYKHHTEGWTREELAGHYECDVTTVARWLSDANRNDIITTRVSPKLPTLLNAERNRRLEEELRDRFVNLQQAVVLSGFSNGYATKGSDEQLNVLENYLHCLIAYGFANHVAATRFRRGDHIGVGGGRGNWFWAYHMPQTDWSDGQVTSLATQTASQLWGQDGAHIESMDADQVAARLHSITGARLTLAGMPVSPN